jgi:hypothetical protein
VVVFRGAFVCLSARCRVKGQMFGAALLAEEDPESLTLNDAWPKLLPQPPGLLLHMDRRSGVRMLPTPNSTLSLLPNAL